MRSTALLLLLAACAGPEFAAPTGEGDPSTAPITVHGVVLDSVTRLRLPGISVGMAGKFVVTDAAGAFTIVVGPGPNSVHVTAGGYEPFARSVVVDPAPSGAVVLELPLRRLAPFPVSCQMGAAGFQATIVDLQGRKSLERWSQSQLTLVTDSKVRTIPAVSWGYQALGDLEWQVTIADADASTIRADWVLFDSQVDMYRGSCEPVPALPDTRGPSTPAPLLHLSHSARWTTDNT